MMIELAAVTAGTHLVANQGKVFCLRLRPLKYLNIAELFLCILNALIERLELGGVGSPAVSTNKTTSRP
jgi:hypothetical protein